MTEVAVLRPDRLGLGEAIRWADGAVMLVDILAGRLLTAPEDPTAPLDEPARLPVPLGAVAPVCESPGTWIAAEGTGICVIAPDGSTRWLARPGSGAPVPMRMNDAGDGAGSLYRVDRDGTPVRVLDGLTVPNGPAFTADGTTMDLADSARGIIRRHPVDPVTAGLGAAETFVVLDDGHPDGAGRVAVWGTGPVRRYPPGGRVDRVLRLPARQPAGVCPESDTLHITTARVGLTAPPAEDGAVFTAGVDVPGTSTPAASCRRGEISE
ncbi:SMP-30/gluconolactonase/LRE family protein [Streptomyces blattellae]|uniref:SMP-30/gluconolactonase/LRE family protein n=1 Tax=Streptomyces blattellae TaxID=2569855 RepID=UPI0012B720AE|nr:SMP-30/gluconolactonase/LRE family protein [Streptomyces blattellae]